MSGWTHAICLNCWNRLHPDRVATRVIAGDIETCCWCGGNAYSGIYMRADPKSLPCLGRRTEVHDDDNSANPQVQDGST